MLGGLSLFGSQHQVLSPASFPLPLLFPTMFCMFTPWILSA